MAGWNKGNKGAFLPSRSLYLAGEGKHACRATWEHSQCLRYKAGVLQAAAWRRDVRPCGESGKCGAPPAKPVPICYPHRHTEDFPILPLRASQKLRPWLQGMSHDPRMRSHSEPQMACGVTLLGKVRVSSFFPFFLSSFLPFISLSPSLWKVGRLLAVWAGMYLLYPEFQLFSTP